MEAPPTFLVLVGVLLCERALLRRAHAVPGPLSRQSIKLLHEAQKGSRSHVV
jgi:hypothetical protein